MNDEFILRHKVLNFNGEMYIFLKKDTFYFFLIERHKAKENMFRIKEMSCDLGVSPNFFHILLPTFIEAFEIT